MPSSHLGSILVATDLGEHSDAIVASAAELAAAAGAELHVLTSFDLQPLPRADEAPEASSFAGRVAEARNALDEQVTRTVPPHVTVASREVVIFVAHKAIRDRAEEVSADLIVLGPHRQRRGDPLLGSTADRVIRTARVPVLVLRGPLSLPLRSLVGAVDLSEPARTALDEAVSWLSLLGAKEEAGAAALCVLHVIPRKKKADADEAIVAAELGREIEDARSRARADDGAVGVDMLGRVRWGEDVAEEVLREAREDAADLLVMGTHGRGPISRALIGSVASAVARRAPCPVLLVPPKTPGREERL